MCVSEEKSGLHQELAAFYTKSGQEKTRSDCQGQVNFALGEVTIEL